MTLLLLLLAALIQVRGQPLEGGTVTGGVELPLDRAAGGDTPVLSLRSSRGGLRLLLDTGATSTMVTPELVRRLGLASSALPPAAFALAGGGSGCGGLRPRRSRLPDLELFATPAAERLRLRGLEALVLPVAALPPGVDGVLGAPTLRRQPVWIDPVAGRLAFGAPALRLAARATVAQGMLPSVRAQPLAAGRPVSAVNTPRFQVVQLRWHQGVPLLGLNTPVGVVPALADTGAEGLFLSRELGMRLPLLGRWRSLRLVGFCGEQSVEQNAVAGLSVIGDGRPQHGSASLVVDGPLTVILTTNPIFQVLGVEAIVGQELLRQRRQLWRLDLDPPRLELL